MTKPWNYGDRFIIEKPKYDTRKRGCFACVNYCDEDKSCLKTEIIPAVDGSSYWKQCKFYSIELPAGDLSNRTYYPDGPKQLHTSSVSEAGKKDFKSQKAIMVPLRLIEIPPELKKKLPSAAMISKCKGFYKERGRFEHYVSVKSVDGKYVLTDIEGCAIFVAAMELDLKGLAVLKTVKKKVRV